MPYSLSLRPLRLDTALGPDRLLVAGFSGVEGVSLPYSFHVDLLSTSHDIKAADLLRTGMTLTIEQADGSERAIHGLVRSFARGERTVDFVRYEAELVPWLWFLSLSRDCKIFQNKTVLEIVEEVFDSQGYTDYEIKCRESYPKREFCVQYRESHLNFVSRLMEEEGIFYFFRHSEDKHVLVLADSNDAFAESPGAAKLRLLPKQAPLPDREDVLLRVRQEHSVHVGKISLKDYDPLQPSLSLASSVPGDGKEEVYDYPGLYTTQDAGDRYARLQLEAAEALRHVVRGEGTCRALRSGYRFTVEDDLRRDLGEGDFVLLRVQHTAKAGEYHSGQAESGFFEYRSEFLAIPHSVTYRPPRQAKKPVVRGSQTAVVVGKSGEEIWTDKHGRVKLHFHWDRDSKKDEKSSCWVRVASPWAGKGWGMINIPRIGQEVIVDFLEGDPDRPIITGRVYNAEQVPPYELPANQTQSGIKSRSSKGGGTENFNEIRMEDKKGEELLYIHAEKDQEIVVENDRRDKVGHDESIEIGNDQAIKVGNDRTESVGNDESISIGGNRSQSIGKDENVSVAGNRSESVGKDETIQIDGKRTETVGKDESVSVGGKRAVDVGKDDTLNVGKKFMLTAGDEITIKTGSASIVLKKDGTITIKGKDITIQGSGKVNVKASSDVVIKGSQVKQN